MQTGPFNWTKKGKRGMELSRHQSRIILKVMSAKVKFWGVRGSIPSAPQPHQWVKDIEDLMRGFFRAGFNKSEQIAEYLNSLPVPEVGGFGTATTCVEITTAKASIIIDGGSGIRNYSEHLMQAGRGKGEFHIFMTHFHWDHLIGLPFFSPNFIRGNVINYYAVQPDLEEIVRGQFKKPHFPVPFEALGATIKFHTLRPREIFEHGDLKITPYELDHPDPCWGYRVETQGKVYSHCVDTEAIRTTREALGPDLPMYQNIDVMYFDAQYTLPELAEKANWGHGAAQLGLDLAFRENIHHMIFAHHDPGATTQQLVELKAQTREYFDWRIQTAATNRVVLPQVKWRYAHEGLELDLTKM